MGKMKTAFSPERMKKGETQVSELIVSFTLEDLVSKMAASYSSSQDSPDDSASALVFFAIGLSTCRLLATAFSEEFLFPFLVGVVSAKK